MKFKKVALVYSKFVLKENKKIFEKVKNILEDEKIDYCDICVDKFNASFLKNVDLVLSLGGDGTFIRVSHFLKDEYILGINSHFNKSEGELLSLNENNINFLKEILNGKFKIEEKVRIEVYLNNILLNEKALNEVYFGARNQFHTSRYVIRVGDKNEEQKSSGVLVVTSTGSKAWYKSAGGKPFRENILKYLVREAFFGRVFNPKLLEGKIRGEIIFISKMCHEGAISIDSNKIYSVFNGDEIKIQLSNENLKVLSI